MKLVVGLGNPGPEYRGTRHNIGFEVIDLLGSKLGLSSYKSKFKGMVGEVNYKGEKIILLKPQTFMNLSGESIVQFMNFYKLDPKEDLIVIYDDMDLPVGDLRVRAKGSAGGHNGIKSTISYLGSEFIRLKCGIGRGQGSVTNFVLGHFTKEEMEWIDPLLIKSVECVTALLDGDSLDKVMQSYNKK